MPDVTTIHRQIAEAWNSRNFDTLRTYAHPDYTYTGGDGKELAGGPETAVNIASLYATAFPDARLEVRRVYSQGNVAIAEMVGRGTHGGDFMGVPATGRPVSVQICNVIEMRDGKIYREREYLDTMSIMQQIGALTMPAKQAGR